MIRMGPAETSPPSSLPATSAACHGLRPPPPSSVLPGNRCSRPSSLERRSLRRYPAFRSSPVGPLVEERLERSLLLAARGSPSISTGAVIVTLFCLMCWNGSRTPPCRRSMPFGRPVLLHFVLAVRRVGGEPLGHLGLLDGLELLAAGRAAADRSALQGYQSDTCKKPGRGQGLGQSPHDPTPSHRISSGFCTAGPTSGLAVMLFVPTARPDFTRPRPFPNLLSKPNGSICDEHTLETPAAHVFSSPADRLRTTMAAVRGEHVLAGHEDR